MIPNAYPEANRLSYRIRTAITGESTGLETAKLAWQQAEAVERANADLKRARNALDSGSLLDCLLIEAAHPDLLETARSLDHSLAEAWNQRCLAYSWRVAPAVDLESVSKIQSAIDSQGDLKEWLFKQYRATVRSKEESLRAYQIIKLIAGRYPEDANAKAECESKQKQLLEQAAAQVKDARDQLIPKETPSQVARRYRLAGLPLSDYHNDILATTLATAEAEYVKVLFDQAVSVVEKANGLEAGKDWQEVEAAYLACDYALAINGARGELPNELKDNFEKVATQLSRIRSVFESSISIRTAISELRHGRQHKGKPVKLANRVAKLKSLESQALKTGSKIPDDLREEIKAAYAYAQRKRLPVYAGLVAIVAVSLTLLIFLVNTGRQRNAAAALESEALAALQAVEQSSQSSQIQEALREWEDAIASAKPTSALAQQAEFLNDWLSLQSSLESQYDEEVADLAKLVDSPDAIENEQAIRQIAEQVRKTRNSLASDLGQATDAQFQVLLSRFDTQKAATQEENLRSLDRLERELRIAATNAAQAKSRQEFDRLRNAAETRSQALTTLLESDYAANKRAQLAPFLQSLAQQLQALGTKWAALDNAWTRLAQTKELAPYLEQLERIHSFDILPAEQKTALSQTLRLKDELLAMETVHGPLANPDAQRVFNAEGPYLRAAVELSAEETAYLERLEELQGFANVYQSTVQYFEGSADPQSEYRIYLVEPISKSDSAPSQSESSVTFTFKVRGFDEFGNPEASARDIQFISREDGSFWGFFYKPSTLSPESEYYSRAIVNNLRLLRAGAGRLTLLEMLKDLESQSQLSPAFRIFWQQQLVGLMEIEPWNWGLALSPSLKKRAARLESLPAAEGNETLWLSIIEQTVPSPEFRLLAEQAVAEQAKLEVATLASLYQSVANGDFLLSGFVLADGTANLYEPLPAGTPLWTVNALTGKLDRISDQLPLTPFAPILHFALPGNQSAAAVLKEAASASKLKLGEPPYRPLLPSPFQ